MGGELIEAMGVRDLIPMSDAALVMTTTGIMMSVVAIGQLWWVMRRFESSIGEFMRHLAFGPALAVLTGLAAQSIGHSLVLSLTMEPGRAASIVELAVVTSVYMGLVLLAVRFTAETTLRDTVSAMPAGVAGPIRRALRLD